MSDIYYVQGTLFSLTTAISLLTTRRVHFEELISVSWSINLLLRELWYQGNVSWLQVLLFVKFCYIWYWLSPSLQGTLARYFDSDLFDFFYAHRYGLLMQKAVHVHLLGPLPLYVGQNQRWGGDLSALRVARIGLGRFLLFWWLWIGWRQISDRLFFLR